MNLILSTDSYKMTHHGMYPDDVETVSSYLEARTGKGLQDVVWFGLQAVLKKYLTKPVTNEDLAQAQALAGRHFSTNQLNVKGWQHIIDAYGGRLPLRIYALPEGTVTERGTPLMVVENTDPKTPWLTNYIETLLMHVWYPTTVASVSYDLRKFFDDNVTGGAPQFMLHDFGYRGCSSHDSAAMGGMAHLLSFMGTDTVAAMVAAQDYYGASFDNLAYSVAATEHSIMTQYGQEGEDTLIRHLMATHPNQILSLVADSYDYYAFVQKVVKNLDVAKQFKCQVVIRPDSPTPQHPDPADVINWTLINTPETVNVLWGDGLTPDQIKDIVRRVDAVDRKRLVFGMGGGLLQKVNRDTLRFALKCSAVKKSDGVWYDVQKNPLDQTKASKAGRQITRGMDLVFDNGLLTQQETFATIRNRLA